ncbi:hypothetical protein [Undibacterium macrobrachii]|jgi:ABC-2 type transport system permease protein|uniref:ABC transporter permease n=1 Tax=Undibacterium macrobrachii TaxID=1119058 RepID=A0ABQ2X967_9BURK|nr:hypothetical protein [Undibacterium macrobrachii]GGX05549.1 ABC transporter permease [Undibacterium macrobrachii]
MNVDTEAQSLNSITHDARAFKLKPYLQTLGWLVKREYWENKSWFFWGPLVITLSICLAYFSVNLLASPWRIHDSLMNDTVLMQKEPFAAKEFSSMFIASTVEAMPIRFQLVIFFILGIGAVISILYLMSSLYSERMDRSILFWKSLPISDWQTIFSKCSFPLLILPAMLWLIATASFFIFISLYAFISVFTSVNMVEPLLLNREMYLTPLKILALFPVYVLWALPSVAWYLMISAWAKSRVFPWAIGVPILSVLFLAFINQIFKFEWDVRWYALHVIARLVTGVFPASWLFEQRNIGLPEHYFSLQNITHQAWLAMQGTSLWIGVVAGILMLFVAVRLRQFNESNT